MKKLIERWNNFSLREKQSLSIGGTLVIVFLLYEIIWSPLANEVDTLRGRVIQNSELLTWMQQADARISILHQKNPIQQTGSILSIMQTEIKKSSFASHVKQLKQAENNTVQLSLQKVGFDAFISWITDIWQSKNLVVTQLTALPTGTPGEVNIELALG